MATTKDVLLVIADISGYTGFMVSSARETEHQQLIIRELLNTLVEQLELPLEVARLEGDAVFLYAVRDSNANTWNEAARKINEKLLMLFAAFHDRLDSLGRSACRCGACCNTAALRLRIIVHSGQALFFSIHQVDEIAGIDVILVHRLLNNATDRDEYLLMTGAAYRDIAFPWRLPLEKGRERYEHFGEIDTLVYYPHKQPALQLARS